MAASSHTIKRDDSFCRLSERVAAERNEGLYFAGSSREHRAGDTLTLFKAASKALEAAELLLHPPS